VEPYTANEEILSSSNCGVSDISHLSITPTKNHTQPYNVSQTGAIRLDSWLVQTYDTDNISALFQVRAIGTGTGANRGFQWGHSSQGLKYFATGKFGQSQDFIPRFYGKSGGSVTSLIYYESSAGTGGVGGFSWRNNDADDTEFLKLDNLGQLFTLAGIFPETAAGTQVGAASLPFNSLYLGTAATNNFKFQPAATAAARTISMPDPLANVSLGFSYNATNPVYQSKRAVAGCTTGAAAGNSCASDITVTWGTAFADANYSVTCTGSTPTNVPSAPFVVSATKLAATVHINYFAITAAAASYATIDCIAVHD
jgi:hypothetical protein